MITSTFAQAHSIKVNMEVFEKAFSTKRTKRSIETGFFKRFKLNKATYQLAYLNALKNYSQHNYKKALKSINTAITKSNTKDWKYYAFQATLHENLMEFQAAMVSYQKAIDCNGKDSQVYALYHQIGYCHYMLKNDEKASEFYHYAITLKPTFIGVDIEALYKGVLYGKSFKKMYYNDARALSNLGDLSDSLKACKKALAYDENYSSPYLTLSKLFSKVGEVDKALKFLKISANKGNQKALKYLNSINYC